MMQSLLRVRLGHAAPPACTCTPHAAGAAASLRGRQRRVALLRRCRPCACAISSIRSRLRRHDVEAVGENRVGHRVGHHRRVEAGLQRARKSAGPALRGLGQGTDIGGRAQIAPAGCARHRECRCGSRPGTAPRPRASRRPTSGPCTGPSVRQVTPCFDAKYGPDPLSSPATDAVLTMCPSSPPASMRGTKARTPCTTPIRLTPMIHCQSARLVSQAGTRSAGAATPALLHNTCTPPNSR